MRQPGQRRVRVQVLVHLVTGARVVGRGVPPVHREDLPAGAQWAEADAKAAWSK